MPLHKVLTRSHHDAFSRDSKLVWEAREMYYWENHPCFNNENPCDVMDILWNMVKSTGLLSLEIHEIRKNWTGRQELQYTNHALRTMLKDLKFFNPVSPSKSPKVMGLTRIHHPDTLCHLKGVTHCLWCGKEGQNEGSIINHLRMVHYKVGPLVQEVLRLSLSYLWGHLMSWLGDLPASHGRRCRGVIFIQLTASWHQHHQIPGGSPTKCKCKTHHTC